MREFFKYFFTIALWIWIIFEIKFISEGIVYLYYGKTAMGSLIVLGGIVVLWINTNSLKKLKEW